MPTDAFAPAAIDPQRIFAILFLMLGPLRIPSPFVQMTQHCDAAVRGQIARRAMLFAAVTLLIAAALGDNMIANFEIPLPVVALAGGLLLFLVALRTVLGPVAARSLPEPDAARRDLHTLAARLAFPTIVTPSGVAAMIVFCALAKNDSQLLLSIGGITLGILLLDWLAMIFAEPILRWSGVILQLFAVVLGVIQVSLGLQLMLVGLSASGVLPLPGR